MLRAKVDFRGQGRVCATLLTSILLVLACGSVETFTGNVPVEPDSDAAGPLPVGDSGPSALPSVQTIGSGTSECQTDEVESDAALEMLPDLITVFERYPAVCEQLGSGVLLRNRGPSSVRVLGLSMSSLDFSIEANVPIELAQGESMAVRVFYRSNDVGSTDEWLTVATTAGCQRFRFHALGTSDALITRSDEALDFGSVAPGGVSEIRRMSIVTDRRGTDTTITYSGFSIGSPLFEVVSAPARGVEPQGCEPLEVSLRFRAPNDLGAVEGTLFWGVTIQSPVDVADALMLVKLYARVTASDQ